MKKGDVIMQIFGKDEECLSPSLEKLKNAITYSDEKKTKENLIYKTIR